MRKRYRLLGAAELGGLIGLAVALLFGEENLTVEAFVPNRELTCPKYRGAWIEEVRHPFAVLD